MGSLIAVSEREVSKLKAEIASKFDVPVDYVDVVVEDDDGTLSVSYAIICLSAQDIKNILVDSKENT